MCTAVSRWWTPQKVEWYVRASQCSDFHERLAIEIASLVPKDKSILEVGCGLGYMTYALAKMGYEIRGIDNDETAVEKALELHGHLDFKRTGCTGSKGPSVCGKDLFALEDYRTSQRKANVVLAVFCGRIDEDGLGSFGRLAGERVLYIVSQHKNNSIRANRTDKICEYLEKSGHRFTFKELSMRFDQPFETLDEAARFFEIQYGTKVGNQAGNQALPVKGNKRCLSGKYPYVFENEKKMSLFDIEI